MADDIYFVRHGQTEWNVQTRLQGRGDSPLTELGKRQAVAHREWLAEAPPDAVLASPLGRVRTTVELATQGMRLEVAFDEALSERCMGDFEGWSMREIAAHDPELAERKTSDPWDWRPPGGEDYNDLIARTAPLIQRLRTHPAKRLLVVSHGTIVRPILAQLLDLDRQTTTRISSPNDLAYRATRGGPREDWRIAHRLGDRWRDGLRLL